MTRKVTVIGKRLEETPNNYWINFTSPEVPDLNVNGEINTPKKLAKVVADAQENVATLLQADQKYKDCEDVEIKFVRKITVKKEVHGRDIFYSSPDLPSLITTDDADAPLSEKNNLKREIKRILKKKQGYEGEIELEIIRRIVVNYDENERKFICREPKFEWKLPEKLDVHQGAKKAAREIKIFLEILLGIVEKIDLQIFREGELFHREILDLKPLIIISFAEKDGNYTFECPKFVLPFFRIQCPKSMANKVAQEEIPKAVKSHLKDIEFKGVAEIHIVDSSNGEKFHRMEITI